LKKNYNHIKHLKDLKNLLDVVMKNIRYWLQALIYILIVNYGYIFKKNLN